MKRHRTARLSRRLDGSAHYRDARAFRVGFVVHVLRGVALVRHRHDRRQRQRRRDGGRDPELLEQSATREADEPFDEKTRHDHRLEQTLQERIAEQAAHVVLRHRPGRCIGGTRTRQPTPQFDGVGTRRHEAHDRAHQARRIDRAMAKRAEQEIADARIDGMAQLEFLDATLELRPVRRDCRARSKALPRCSSALSALITTADEVEAAPSARSELGHDRRASAREAVQRFVQRRVESKCARSKSAQACSARP